MPKSNRLADRLSRACHRRAIDFDMALERQPDPKGNRVKITMSGKFLQYEEH